MDRRSLVVPGEPVRVTSNGRRYFSKAHKEAVITKCLVPGASLAAVALANGFNANQVRKWVRDHQVRELGAKAEAKLLPVAVEAAGVRAVAEGATSGALGAGPCGSIEIRLGRIELLVHGLVDHEQLALVLNALMRSR